MCVCVRACVRVCVQATVSKHMCSWIFQLLKWQHLQQKWGVLYIFALNAVALDSNWLVGGYWGGGGGGGLNFNKWCVYIYIHICVSLKFSTSCPMNWSGFSHEEIRENDFFPLLWSIPWVKWGLDLIWPAVDQKLIWTEIWSSSQERNIRNQKLWEC